ncbi:MAG: NYN domain-containing protein [Patescibacteria group bacterium]
MDLKYFKLQTLGIDKERFGRIFSFVDYGNVNYWYDKDRRGNDDVELIKNQKLIIDIEKLASFATLFSEQKRFYYGWNNRKKSNWHIAIKAEKFGFIKITKPIQFIKHYLTETELNNNSTFALKENLSGKYIEIPKSNFDVEVSVDALRLMDKFDTFCIFSGDSDFTYLVQYLKRKGKKIIVIASGQVFHTLKDLADLYINAQTVKVDIASIKETAPLAGRGLDIGSVSDGQGSQ